MHAGDLRIAVIGAGPAGRELAAAASKAGFAVVLEDVMPARLRRAEQAFETLGALVELVLTVEDAVREADVVIDFVPDELESKLEIWSLIDRMAPPRTIMLTPSDNLSITDLASCTYRADRCVMLRGKLHAGQPLRLLQASATSPETVAVALAVLRDLGETVTAEADPDLPMLLKNMNALTL